MQNIPMECCTEEPSDLFIDQDTQDYLVKSRRIFINGDINSNLALYVNSYLQRFSISDPKKPVYLYISSSGGDVTSGYSIIDQMLISPFKIYTIVRGCAYSMAAIITAFGSKKYRFITPNSSMMIHSGMLSSGLESLDLLKRRIDFLHKDDERKTKILSSRLNINYKKLLELIEKNYWMDSEETIKIGFVDGLWTKNLEQKINAETHFEEKKTNN